MKNYKVRLFSILLFLLMGIGAKAQVLILNESMFQGRMSEIKTTVVDSLTNEPVAFASVYVIPSKDTTITNFTLSDANGEAKLDEVPYGSYVFHVEMLGYKPIVKERYFRERRVDMGTLRMQVDEQYLQAATITDIGNPIVVKQDTVEFNASSFRVGANAMLKDLLKRMPGMEITEEGKVLFNGEAIDKLTVGGRTFFFNDQSTALNNLPAAVVDKIRVIDRESEATRATGIQDGTREKVLDVALKKEYEKGWFGNVGLKGGTTLVAKDDDNPLRDNRGLLWSGNALVSAYTEKDQLTVIANGQNVDDSGMVLMILDEDGEESLLNQGLSTAAQLGINVNTTRIKDVESTAAANYKFTDTDSGTSARRTTYQEGGNLVSTTNNGGKQYAHSLGTDLEFEKEAGKVWFHIRPGFDYNWTDAHSNGSSETLREGAFVNSSRNESRSISTRKSAEFDGDVSFREIGGKKNRILSLDLTAAYTVTAGNSDEASSLTIGSGASDRNMHYVSDGKYYGFTSSVRYTEPLGEKWALSTAADFTWAERSQVRDAFENAVQNGYYSSESRSHSLQQQYELTAQYKWGDQSWITLGGRVMGTLNETFSKSYGIETVSGEDEWDWHVVPSIRFQHRQGIDRLSMSVYGYSVRPANTRMLPVLNITDPSRLSMGNVYLKPYTRTYLSADWTRNNRERFSTLMVFSYVYLISNPVSNAIWFDPDGIQYSLPVNAQKPSVTATLVANYTTPLDSRKLWSLSFNARGNYNASISYQTKTALPGLDKEAFDYSAFMADFWGDENGNRFYSGQSGFQESKTRVLSPAVGIGIKFNPENYSFGLRVNSTGRIARYSLDPSVNMNTLDTYLSAQGSYTTKHEFEIETDLSYVFYNGYAEGYGQPEWQWNAEISKNIGAFNLSVTLHDILNQTRNLTHTVNANYEEDSYKLVMGRYILFGVKWNFGKMNASHSQRAQNAVWNMAW